jgi:hypothetical protein
VKVDVAGFVLDNLGHEAKDLAVFELALTQTGAGSGISFRSA